MTIEITEFHGGPLKYEHKEDWRKRGIMTQCSVICLDIAIDHIPREDLKNRILTFSKVDRKIVLSHNQFEIFTLYRSRYALARQDGQRYRLTADGLKFSFKEHNSNVFIFFEDIAPNMRSSSSAPLTASSPTSSLEATSSISSNSKLSLSNKYQLSSSPPTLSSLPSSSNAHKVFAFSSVSNKKTQQPHPTKSTISVSKRPRTESSQSVYVNNYFESHGLEEKKTRSSMDHQSSIQVENGKYVDSANEMNVLSNESHTRYNQENLVAPSPVNLSAHWDSSPSSCAIQSDNYTQHSKKTSMPEDVTVLTDTKTIESYPPTSIYSKQACEIAKPVNPKRSENYSRFPSIFSSVKKIGSSISSWAQSSLSSSVPMEETNRSSGFKNIGNTCYMASVLQVMLTLHPYVNDLQSLFWKSLLDAANNNNQNSSNFDQMVVSEFLLVIKNRNDSLSSFDLNSLKKSMGQYISCYSSNQQQDAHEFYLHFLDIIDKELQKSLPTWIARSRKEEEVSWETKDAITQLFPQYCLPARRHFDMLMESTFECVECGYRRENYEYHRNISLEIDIPTTTADEIYHLTLEQLMEKCILEKDFLDLSCERCPSIQGKVRVHKRFCHLSSILTINFQRFQYTMNGEVCKNNASISFPDVLDLSAFLSTNERSSTTSTSTSTSTSSTNYELGCTDNSRTSESNNSHSNSSSSCCCSSSNSNSSSNSSNSSSNSSNSRSLFDECSFLQDHFENVNLEEIAKALKSLKQDHPSLHCGKDRSCSSYLYQLCGVVRHFGSSAHVGHYVSDVLESVEQNQWIRCNDSIVRSIDKDSVFRDCSSPYLLFYVRL